MKHEAHRNRSRRLVSHAVLSVNVAHRAALLVPDILDAVPQVAALRQLGVLLMRRIWSINAALANLLPLGARSLSWCATWRRSGAFSRSRTSGTRPFSVFNGDLAYSLSVGSAVKRLHSYSRIRTE